MESFIVHSNYSDISTQLKEIINQFDTVGEVIALGNRNVIKKVVVEGEAITIKKFKNPNFFQGIVYRFFRKSKAKRSFEYAKKLLSCSINTPFPVAYFEHIAFGLKESYYICKYVAYDFDFRVLNHNPKCPERKKILEQFTAFTFKLHENNINFLDHSPGNTLINKTEKGYDFSLIDLNRMQFEAMSFHKRMKNFRRLWLSKTMINIMAPVYAKLYDKTEEETHQLMTRYSRRFQKKVNSKKLRKRRK